jgi:DNA modification methylase
MTEADILKRYQDIVSRDYMLTENPYNVVEGYGSKREAQAYLVSVYKENDYDMSYEEWLDDIRSGGYSPALTRAVNAIDAIKEAIDEKRYLVSVEMYMYAKDDEDVQKQAQRFADQLKAKHDNQAVVMSIYEQPFGTLGNRKLFDKND